MNVFRLQREAQARSHEARVARDRGDWTESTRLHYEAAELWGAATERWRVWEGRLLLVVIVSAVMCAVAAARWVS